MEGYAIRLALVMFVLLAFSFTFNQVLSGQLNPVRVENFNSVKNFAHAEGLMFISEPTCYTACMIYIEKNNSRHLNPTDCGNLCPEIND